MGLTSSVTRVVSGGTEADEEVGSAAAVVACSIAAVFPLDWSAMGAALLDAKENGCCAADLTRVWTCVA